MDIGDWNFWSDEEIADSRPARGGQDGVYINSLRADTPTYVYFLTRPGESATDWLNFRELTTYEGLWMDVEMPQDLTFGVMVQDDYMVTNAITGKHERHFDNNRDPLTAGEPGKQMWRTGPKNVDKNGLVKVRGRVAVNIVDALTGYHKVLKMSPKAKEDLVKYFNTAASITEENGSEFNIQGRPYQILWTGENFNWNIAISTVRPGSQVIRDGKAIEVPRNMELPPPVDVRQVLIEQRQQMDAFIASLPTRSGQPADTTPPDFVQEAIEGTWENNWEVFGKGNISPNGEESIAEKYLAMSPARLRAILTKAGYPPEKGAPKPDMAAQAASLNL